jgi:hypothetical protein
LATGKYGSASVGFLVDGFNLLVNGVQGLRYKLSALTEPTHGLGSSYEEHTPTGMSKVELAQDGAFWDTGTASIHAAMAAKVPTSPQATPRVICLGFAGQTIGEPAVGLQGAFSTSYDVLGQNEKLTKANVEYLISGRLDHGRIVQELAAKTADWNTKTLGTQIDHALDNSQQVIPITSNSIANPSVVTTPVPHGLTTGDIVVIAGVATSSPTINGERTVTVISTTTFSVPVNVTTGGTGGTIVRANTSGGAVGYMQVTACTGFTNFVGKFRDSADDVTFADLLTMTDNVTAPYAERATVAGVVDRYVCFDGNVTGTGSITIFAMLARL